MQTRLDISLLIHDALARGAALAISISGGKDSQAMLRLLAMHPERDTWAPSSPSTPTSAAPNGPRPPATSSPSAKRRASSSSSSNERKATWSSASSTA
jgi:hypothetical protein